MAKQVMHRAAGDNEYLHRDFHGALSAGIEYLHENYGEEAVREYLWQFARAFYAPLTDALNRRGLVALEEHFREIYELEGGEVRFHTSDDELRVEVDACPAVTHMRKQSYPVARLFHETTATVNRAICHGTPFSAELLDYDDETGRGIQALLPELIMISCTEFIPAYSELFKFLEARNGPRAVEDFWEYLSDRFLGNLKTAVQQHGLRGCWEYWSHTLNEEAADFTMELDEDAGQFRIVMHRCPSMSQLVGIEHIQPYHDYCRHCDVLYRRVLEPLGYRYTIDLSRCHEAQCTLTVTTSESET